MPDNIWFIAAIWMGMAFIASLISIRVGISVALIEILMGVGAGNFLGINHTTPWIDFLAMLGSGILTFLAGAEIDPHSLKGQSQGELLDRNRLVCAALRGGVALRPVRARMDVANNPRSRASHYPPPPSPSFTR